MSTDSVKSQVCEVLSTVLGQQVTEDATRAGIAEWDSLKHMSVVFGIEEQFDVQFTEEQIPELNSVELIAAAIEATS